MPLNTYKKDMLFEIYGHMKLLQYKSIFKSLILGRVNCDSFQEKKCN